MDKKSLKPIAAALGTTFVVSLAASPVTQAAENPFALNDLSKGYEVLAEGNCGEGKCGDKGEDEGKCGDKGEDEGKCGDKGEDEGKCGEGKCGN